MAAAIDLRRYLFAVSFFVSFSFSGSGLVLLLLLFSLPSAPAPYLLPFGAGFLPQSAARQKNNSVKPSKTQ